ncbi:uncharacterized protein BT62DRAFT_106886 [Guyanagaster necrorhizus]|uniref:Uncharacterized protein n=1 Tax=Guyanagaster necrorhizus TaxID=856835 RepID=A0A9P7VUD2_9AGAR|nr:uncharacterized protein BT62DRAFT_106886 [Guyanagaster necrorhizus MCA 3950]KAG7446264.1 hypothetical protein BT62DRAFT_106886 [Guyanagaster necrorhizus MCA 3950]
MWPFSLPTQPAFSEVPLHASMLSCYATLSLANAFLTHRNGTNLLCLVAHDCLFDSTSSSPVGTFFFGWERLYYIAAALRQSPILCQFL